MDTTMLTVLLTLCLTCALMSLVVTVFFRGRAFRVTRR